MEKDNDDFQEIKLGQINFADDNSSYFTESYNSSNDDKIPVLNMNYDEQDRETRIHFDEKVNIQELPEKKKRYGD